MEADHSTRLKASRTVGLNLPNVAIPHGVVTPDQKIIFVATFVTIIVLLL